MYMFSLPLVGDVVRRMAASASRHPHSQCSEVISLLHGRTSFRVLEIRREDMSGR